MERRLRQLRKINIILEERLISFREQLVGRLSVTGEAPLLGEIPASNSESRSSKEKVVVPYFELTEIYPDVTLSQVAYKLAHEESSDSEDDIRGPSPSGDGGHLEYK